MDYVNSIKKNLCEEQGTPQQLFFLNKNELNRLLSQIFHWRVADGCSQSNYLSRYNMHVWVNVLRICILS